MRRFTQQNRSGILRRGTASIEVVASAAVMLPVAGGLFFLGLRMSAEVYQAIGALVAWPFL